MTFADHMHAPNGLKPLGKPYLTATKNAHLAAEIIPCHYKMVETWLCNGKMLRAGHLLVSNKHVETLVVLISQAYDMHITLQYNIC